MREDVLVDAVPADVNEGSEVVLLRGLVVLYNTPPPPALPDAAPAGHLAKESQASPSPVPTPL